MPAQVDNLKRLTKTMLAALARRDGSYFWRVGDDAKSRFRAVDGTEMMASALSPTTWSVWRRRPARRTSAAILRPA